MTTDERPDGLPDELVDGLRRQQPPWDDLLEQRVLHDVHATHRARRARRRLERRWGALAAVLVLVAGLGAWILGSSPGLEPGAAPATAPTLTQAEPAPTEARTRPSSPEPGTPEPGMDAPPSPSAERASVMTLTDGSRLWLDDGAQVEALRENAEAVTIVQHHGRVRYEIHPDPDRDFVVRVGSHRVRVLGTIFVVEIAAERLHVEVERGLVEVSHGERIHQLAAEERLELPLRVEPEPAPPVEPKTHRRGPTVASLLDRADAARREHRLLDAAALLEQLVARHGGDPRAPSAWFMLGRVRRQLGRHAAAASAFARAAKASSSPALTEDARAEQAVSLDDAGTHDEAVLAAKRYLARHPNGTHAARMRAIVR